MKKYLFFCLLVWHTIGFSQTPWVVDLKSPYSDAIIDFVKIDNLYLLCLVQANYSQYKNTYSYRNIFIKVSESGQILDSLTIDTFGSNSVLQTVFLHNDTIYTTHIVDFEGDTSKLKIVKWDKNLNFLQQKIFTSTKGRLIRPCPNHLINGDIIMIMGDHRDATYTNRDPFILKIHLPTLSLIKEILFNEEFIGHELMYNFQNGNFQIITSFLQGYKWASLVPKFDSTATLVRVDTLPNITQFKPNYLSYKDSLFLVSGMGTYPDEGFYFRQLCLQVLDSNFQTQSPPLYFHHDSTDAWPADGRSLIMNHNKEVFIAASLEPTIYCSTPDIGLLAVKLDSNLNMLWKRHIPGNRYDYVSKIISSPDGGLLLTASQKELNSSWPNHYNARLIKLGPNGEITSVVSLNNPQGRKIRLYPNPAEDILNIEFGSFDNLLAFEVYNMQGKKVLVQSGKDMHTLNIASIPSGIYLLKATCRSGEVMTERFVKY